MTRRARTAALALALVTAGAGRARAQEVAADSVAAARAIEAAATSFSRAMERGDAGTMAAQYTADATLLPPGGRPVTGCEAIRRFWTPRNPEFRTVRHELTTERLEVSGDTAVDLGRWRQVARVGERPESEAWGRYLVVWRRVGERKWKMQFDAWTSPIDEDE